MSTREAFMSGYQCYRWALTVQTHNGSREATNLALCVPEECCHRGHDCLFNWGHGESSPLICGSSAETQGPPRPAFLLINQTHFLHLTVCTHVQECTQTLFGLRTFFILPNDVCIEGTNLCTSCCDAQYTPKSTAKVTFPMCTVYTLSNLFPSTSSFYLGPLTRNLDFRIWVCNIKTVAPIVIHCNPPFSAKHNPVPSQIQELHLHNCNDLHISPSNYN